MIGYYIIGGIFFLASLAVSQMLKSKFNKYSKIPLPSGMSGADVAREMLRGHGITDVTIESVQGKLTDHYNPMNKTVNLSPEVYSGNSVAAAAIAAHECGHAVQHAEAYAFLTMRSKMVPAVSIASSMVHWVLLAGLILLSFNFPWLLLAGIILFAITTLFSFVTLPVEFDASRRALAWLNNSRVAQGVNHDYAKDALTWAAMTYVVAALASLANLLYFVMIYLNRR